MQLNLHYDNHAGFHNPYLTIATEGKPRAEYAPTGQDSYGFTYQATITGTPIQIRFKDGAGETNTWENESLTRLYAPKKKGRQPASREIWCRGYNAFVYSVEPRKPESETAPDFVGRLSFKSSTHIPDSGGLSGLGANVLTDGRVLFGLFHPNAARVFVTGDFNDWQYPGLKKPKADRMIELKLYRGYFNMPNTWLAIVDRARAGQEYKFFIRGGVPQDGSGQAQLLTVDPYAQQIGDNYEANNAVIVDSTTYQWHDGGWKTPLMNDFDSV